MLKHEFEKLALRGNATISNALYEAIEAFYMSDNYYHQRHGGTHESKQDFVKRVFGGKVNTPQTILKKITAESIRENRYYLQGTATTKPQLDAMDTRLTEYYQTLSRMA